MRVLLVPEVYRPRSATACGTVNDAATWVERWLERDPHMHVYWLLPPRELADYEAEYVHADRERVTLIEAEGLATDLEGGAILTEDGYSAAELSALRATIFDRGAYVDFVVDQRRSGRFTLVKWLLDHVDHWAASVRPFDLIANVHDLQVPRKYHFCSYRDGFQGRMAICGSVFADGIWFSAGVDARRLREHATDFLSAGAVERAMGSAVEIGSPIDFDGFDESYADEPRWLHVAGSFWEKKNADRVFDVARRLDERFGLRTLLTSMDPIPASYRRPEWVEAHGEADRDAYRSALDRGDLAICASEYETLARTPFEQAASGQVLLLRDAPWIHDCVPEGHPLVADLDGLGDLAVAAVKRWDDAVTANRELVEHVRAVRSPAGVGRRTYADLAGRIEGKRRRFAAAGRVQVVRRALVGRETIGLDAVVEAAAEPDENPGSVADPVVRTDVIYALRSIGFRDRGNAGTPVFERAMVRPADPPARHRSP